MLIFYPLININQTSLWSSNSRSASRHKCCNESTWAANWTKRAMNACSSPWLRSTTAWDSRRFCVKSSFSLSAWKQNIHPELIFKLHETPTSITSCCLLRNVVPTSSHVNPVYILTAYSEIYIFIQSPYLWL